MKSRGGSLSKHVKKCRQFCPISYVFHDSNRISFNKETKNKGSEYDKYVFSVGYLSHRLFSEFP